ncbi:MAG: nucleotidyltransferase domain-containing protein [bacterium]|nr:nucleotidyltransferase domain-containing protein [bacterium]
MKTQIRESLRRIEDSYDVRILYACESGSRAWGFASADSDYDVRFLYLRPKQWYLSINIEHKRDVIESPIDSLLDVSGWDLKKALSLFRKSNPPLLEWLNSPLIYRDRYGVADKLRELLPQYYSPKACFYHYLHMAKGNYREYLKGEQVWIKKYFYVLRPILAIRWIEQYFNVVPVKFQVLVDHLIQSPELKREIENLIRAKKEGQELDTGPKIPIISEFIEAELKRLEGKALESEKPPALVEPLNELFRTALDEVG